VSDTAIFGCHHGHNVEVKRVPLTVAGLVGSPELRLTLRAGEGSLDRPIAWAHTSELVDPTPFLEGGELLLTTGQLLRRPSRQYRAYVQRLADAGAAGLGFGVGLPHVTTPSALVDAAQEIGLPLVEIPLETPFIAISKAVSRSLAADEYAAIKQTYEAQQAMTRAALAADGPGSLVRQVSKVLNCWALLLDAGGSVLHAAPTTARRRRRALDEDLDRLWTARPPASAATTLGDDTVVIQSLGAGGVVRGFLAAGRSTPWTAQDHHVLNTAASLLTLGREQSRRLDEAHRRLRVGAWKLLLAGELEAAEGVTRDLGGSLPDEPLRVLAVAGDPGQRIAAADLLMSRAAAVSETAFHAETEQHLVVVVKAERALDAWVTELPSRLSNLFIGVSEICGYPDLAEGHRQAAHAAEGGVAVGTHLSRFGDLAHEGLGRFMDTDRAQAFAAACLEPLVAHDRTGRGDLVNSLRVWLAHHGQWDPAAARLGVHRHTLRQRIDKAQRLLARDLSRPGDRAELWLALEVHTALSSSTG